MSFDPIKESFTCYAFEHVTKMRNPQSDHENTCTTIAKRFTAGAVYAILPLVAIVEAVVRGILAIPVHVASCCCKNEVDEGCVGKLWKITADGAFFSSAAGCMSVAAFFFNFTKDRINAKDLEDAVVACFKGCGCLPQGGSQSSERDISSSLAL